MTAVAPCKSIEIPKNQWITPDQQLDRFIVVDQRIVSIVEKFLPIEGIATMAVRYAANELPSILTNWYTSLQILNVPLIPPLPEDIWKIIEEKCLFYGQEVSAGGTFYTTAETNILTLVAEEWKDLGTLFAQMESYSKEQNSCDPTCFQLPDPWILAIKEYEKVPFAPSHWILTPKDICVDCESSVPEAMLGGKRFQDARFEIPSLHEILAVTFSYTLATGAPFFEPGNKMRELPCKYGEMQKITENDYLVVAKFSDFFSSCYARVWLDSDRLPNRSYDFAAQLIPVRRL